MSQMELEACQSISGRDTRRETFRGAGIFKTSKYQDYVNVEGSQDKVEILQTFRLIAAHLYSLSPHSSKHHSWLGIL